jgi:hypothetical protein
MDIPRPVFALHLLIFRLAAEAGSGVTAADGATRWLTEQPVKSQPSINAELRMFRLLLFLPYRSARLPVEKIALFAQEPRTG